MSESTASRCSRPKEASVVHCVRSVDQTRACLLSAFGRATSSWNGHATPIAWGSGACHPSLLGVGASKRTLRALRSRVAPGIYFFNESAEEGGVLVVCGRGSACSPHEIGPSDWKTCGISGRIRGQEGLLTSAFVMRRLFRLRPRKAGLTLSAHGALAMRASIMSTAIVGM